MISEQSGKTEDVQPDADESHKVKIWKRIERNMGGKEHAAKSTPSQEGLKTGARC